MSKRKPARPRGWPSRSDASRRDVLPVRQMRRPRSPTMKAAARGGEAADHGPGALMPSTNRVEACQQRKKRARRGRPPKAEQPQEEVDYRLGVESAALERAKDEQGWFVLATTVGAEGCSDSEVLQAYQEQNTTGEPGFRWIKNPAAITPVWLEKPERIAT